MEKVSSVVWKFLVSKGIDTVFMVDGGGAMHLDDSLLDFPEIRKVICLHEQAAAIAAVGYAHATGLPAVCLVTSGPGGTNAITGCLAAWMDGIPVIFISGQVKVEMIRKSYSGLRSLGSQEADIIGMVEPITKFCFTENTPNNILMDLEFCYKRAVGERPGPTWLDIPLDIQAAEINFNEALSIINKYPVEEENSRILPISAIYATAQRFREAKRPAIMIGWGAMDLSTMELIDQFLGDYPTVPVLLTWKAMQFLPEEYVSYIGRPGGIGQRAANWTQQYCDFLLCIGCRLDQDQIAFNKEHFAPYAWKAAVDISYEELLKNNTMLDMPIWTSAGEFMKEFLKFLEDMQDMEPKTLIWSDWLSLCIHWKHAYRVPHVPAPGGTIDLYHFIDLLSEQCEDGDLIVLGSSASCANVPCQMWKVKWGQKFIFEPAIGAMGIGIPELLGAGIAQQTPADWSKRAILINGDGGFQLNLPTLETIRANNINAKIFYLNNGGYASIRSMQRRNFGRLIGSNEESGLSLPDIKKLARGYGYETFQLSGGNILRKIHDVLHSPLPTLVEIMIDENMEQQPRTINEPDPEHPGKWIPAKMEDMWPYMEREELKKIEEMALRII
jgi:acetolactate synthase I/II/III large subunit